MATTTAAGLDEDKAVGICHDPCLLFLLHKEREGRGEVFARREDTIETLEINYSIRKIPKKIYGVVFIFSVT